MSYERMAPEIEKRQAEIEALMEKAEGADAAEDDPFGDLADVEIPAELKRRESRLAKIKEAKAALEEAARKKAQDHVDQMEAEGRNHRTNPDEAVPDPKAQRNFTDPESKIMKTSNKGFDQCGNAQAVANEAQMIIAADVTDQANDVRQTIPMVDQTVENLDAAGVEDNIGAFSADTGYFTFVKRTWRRWIRTSGSTMRSSPRAARSTAIPSGISKRSSSERPDTEGTDGPPQPNEEGPNEEGPNGIRSA